MSVKIVRESHTECPLIQEIGGYCYCRPNPTLKQLKDRKAQSTYKYGHNRIVIDFANYPQFKKILQAESEPAAAGDGRAPHRHFIEVSVDFGVVPVETSAYREIQVVDSLDPKPAKRIEVHDREDATGGLKMDSVFRTLLPASRMMKPGALTLQLHGGGGGDCRVPPACKSPLESGNKFRIVFEPELPSMHYSEVYYVWVDHNAGIVLKCHGLSEGPHICFSENVLNFGAQYFHDESHLKFAMHNHSDVETQFQFDHDNVRSAFKICPIQGCIQPRTVQTVQVTFAAPKPQTFYKRVMCLIHHQQPQFLELLGLCIPRPLFVFGPIDFCLSSAATAFLPLPSESNAEFFESERHWGLHFSKDVIDFGFHDLLLQRGVGNQASVLRITSILPYDVMIEWVPDKSGVFTISPMASILPARQYTLFDLHFKPEYPETFYNGQLECYVLPTERLWPTVFGPPWLYYPSKDQELPYEHEQMLAIASPETEVAENDGKSKDVSPVVSKTKLSGSPGRKVSEEKTTEPAAPKKSTRRKSIIRKKKSNNNLAAQKAKEEEAAKRAKEEEAAAETEVPPVENEPAANLDRSSTVSVLEFKQELMDSIAKLNETIPKSQKAKLIDSGQQAFPVSLNFRHSGCNRPENFTLLPHELGSPDSLASIASASEVGISRTSFVYHHHDRYNNRDDSLKVQPSKSRELEIKVDDAPEEAQLVLEVQTQKNSEGESEGVVCGKDLALPSDMPPELAIPLCLTLRVCGHTFEKNSPVPQFTVPNHVTMPPTWPLTRVFRSFILRNVTDLPVYYDAQANEDDEVYSMKPSKGVIQGNSHQIILVSMAPRISHASDYIYKSNIVFNFQDENVVSLRGVAELPAIDIVILHQTKLNEREIVCPETMPGCGSDTIMEFRNSSRYHYRFWFEPTTTKHLSAFTPIPTNGYVAPHETVRIIWRFTPDTESAFFVKWCMCLNVFRARADLKSLPMIYMKELTLVGIGRHVKLDCAPEKLEFGSVGIFTQKEMQLVVHNPTDAFVKVKVRVAQKDDSTENQVRIEPTQFVLHGNQTQALQVTVRPDRTGIQEFYIEYALVFTEIVVEAETQEDHSKQQQQVEFTKICDVAFEGSHATLQVIDAAMQARHPLWDTSQCWAFLSLNQLNECLHPCRILARESDGGLPHVPTVTFNFPPATANSPPAVFSFRLANIEQQLKGAWKIYMVPPRKKEPDLAERIWARKKAQMNTRADKSFALALRRNAGSCSCGTHVQPEEKPTNIKEKVLAPSFSTKLLQNLKYFKISPLKGYLDPEQSQEITFTYSYRAVGQHETLALLHVRPGIFIWIKLQGQTYAPWEKFVHLMHDKTVDLHPVCVADLDPPTQMFWIFNGGNADCNFEVDPTVFEGSQEVESNSGKEVRVFDCLTPSGTIPARSWAPVKIRFSPVALIEYEAVVEILANEEQRKVMLRGKGIASPCIDLGATIGGEAEAQLLDPMVPATLHPATVCNQFILTGQKSSSTVVITNLSSGNKLAYWWPFVQIEGGGSISFDPPTGVIEPNQQATIVVTVQGGSVSTLFSRSIRCIMVDKNALARYELMQQVWEYNKANLMNSISEEDAEKVLKQKFGPQPKKPPTFSRLVTVKAYVGTVFGLMDETQEEPAKTEGLSPFMANISGEIVSDILWDSINAESLSACFDHASKSGRGTTPTYYNYKDREMHAGMGKDKKRQAVPCEDDAAKGNPAHVHQQASKVADELLQDLIFNLMQEAASAFRPNKNPCDFGA